MAGQSVEVNRRLGHSFDREFDVVVAGAGSAGCVLASRLTDNPSIALCLIEAGGRDRLPWIHIPLGFGKLVPMPACCLTDAAILSGMILFILAAGATFSWVLTIAYLPQRLVDSLLAFDASEGLFLIASIILLIVTGSILEGLPAMLILGPLLIPMAEQIGINPLHYAIVILIAMGIGVFVPPIGVGFYIATAVFATNIERTARAMLPYFLTLCVGLLLVAFFPWVILALPKLFNLAR